jgi:hypothetical protein
MNKTILLIGALDTKGHEFGFVKNLIENHGLNTLIIDTGVLGDPLITPDISSGETAKAGGSTLENLRRRGDRGMAVDVMIKGVRKLVPELYEKWAVRRCAEPWGRSRYQHRHGRNEGTSCWCTQADGFHACFF